MTASTSELQKSLDQLRSRLERVTSERDQLRQDVESLCLAGGDSMFSGSYVLSEKITSLNKELKVVKDAMSAAKAEQEIAVAEASEAKAAMKSMENQLASVRQDLAAASNEREFYQASVTRCMAETESQKEECQSLRSRLAECELLLSKTEAQASTEGRGRKEAEALAAQRQQQVVQLRNELEVKKGECNTASRQLTQQREANRKLEASISSLNAKLKVAGEDLDRTTQQLQQFRESEWKLRLQWQEAQASAAQLQGISNGQAEQLSSLTKQLSELKSASEQRIAELSASETALKAQLESAQEKVGDLSEDLRGTKQELQKAEQRLLEMRQAEHQHRTGVCLPGFPPSANTSMSSHKPADPSSLQPQHDVSHAGTNAAVQQVTTQDQEHVVSASGTTKAGAEQDAAAAQEQASRRASIEQQSEQQQQQQEDGVMNGVSTSVGAQIDAEDDAEQLGILRTMVHDLKVKLALATQEKVQALLSMAEVKQSLATAQQQVKQLQQQSKLMSKSSAVPSKAASSAQAYHHHTASTPMAVENGAAGLHGHDGVTAASPPAGGIASLFASRFGSFRSIAGGGWMPGLGVATSTSQHHPAGNGGAQGQHALDSSQPATPSARQKAAANLTAAAAAGATGSPRSHDATLATRDHMEGARSARNSFGGGSVSGDSNEGSRGGNTSALSACVRGLVLEASDHVASVKAAARVIVASQTDPALKWAALTGLSQLHVQLNHTRARMGIAKPATPFDSAASGDHGPNAAVAAIRAGAGREGELCSAITALVMELVDLVLACLEAYHRQEALASVMTH